MENALRSTEKLKTNNPLLGLGMVTNSTVTRYCTLVQKELLFGAIHLQKFSPCPCKSRVHLETEGISAWIPPKKHDWVRLCSAQSRIPSPGSFAGKTRRCFWAAAGSGHQ